LPDILFCTALHCRRNILIRRETTPRISKQAVCQLLADEVAGELAGHRRFQQFLEITAFVIDIDTRSIWHLVYGIEIRQIKQCGTKSRVQASTTSLTQ
jgi:hypothetical protein